MGIDPEEETKLYGVRERLTELLEEGPLSMLNNAEWMVERMRQEEIPTSVILELVSFVLPTRKEIRYRLLAEGDAGERAELIGARLDVRSGKDGGTVVRLAIPMGEEESK